MSNGQQNQLALVSLVAGLLSWMVLPMAGAVVAIVTGHMARKQIRTTHEDGDQLAVAGLILGYSHLAMTCLICGAVVGIYGVSILAAFGMAATQQPH